MPTHKSSDYKLSLNSFMIRIKCYEELKKKMHSEN